MSNPLGRALARRAKSRWCRGCRAAIFVVIVLGLPPVLAGCANRNVPRVYMDTLAMFDRERPGYGGDVLRPAELYEQPKAYCLYASAEARRFSITRDRAALENALRATDWLVDNADLDGDGVIGWGLPMAWDAGGDGSQNPPNTEYAIETAMGIQALLDVVDALDSEEEQLRRTRYLARAIDAASTYAIAFVIRAEGGFVSRYSSEEADSYHVLNVTAMMAGQLQRLSLYVTKDLAASFAEFADEGIRYILLRTQRSAGVPFWLYYGDVLPLGREDNQPNDLQHESYVVQGLLDYKIHGGRLGDSIEPSALLKNLARFIEGDRVRLGPSGFTYIPSMQSAAARWADLWRLGYALHVAIRLEEVLLVGSDLSSAFLTALYTSYRDQDGSWLCAPDNQVPCAYPRQLAFVLLGLAFYEYQP